MADHEALKRELVDANRMLANEGILDAFGHVSVRLPEEECLLVSQYCSPTAVTPQDVIRMTLDGRVLDDADTYSEMVIHRAIYRNRDDVNAVVHHHAPSIIPFTALDLDYRPITHMGSPFANGVPMFDDYAPSHGKLIVEEDEGERMAGVLGEARAMLLANHGANVVGSSLREAVAATYYFVTSARQQLAAESCGTPRYFEEPGGSTEDVLLRPRTVDRVWQYLQTRH